MSRFEIRVLPIPGYDTSDAVQTYGIRENDSYMSPEATPDEVVYQFRNGNRNDSCVCEADKPDWASKIVNGVQFGLTDSTNYCPDSPYQGPGN